VARYFLDSSALAKRYISEPGQGWIQSLCTGSDTIHISQLATVEVVHAIRKRAAPEIERAHGKRRLQLISERNALMIAFQDHCDPATRDYVIQALTPDTFMRAAQIVQKYGAQSLDAKHLADALILHDEVQRRGASPVNFVTADAQLLRFARQLIRLVDNPDDHAQSDESLPAYTDWRAQFERLCSRLYEFSRRLNRGR
jgi:predicted nucleic acid-binding protein